MKGKLFKNALMKHRGMEKFIIVGLFVGMAIVLAVLCKEQIQLILTSMFTAVSDKAAKSLF